MATTAYKSTYAGQIDDLLNKVVNRQQFSYDQSKDPAYAALEKTYSRLGDQAEKNTLGDVAMNTGGLASTAAVTAASQAKGQFNQQLIDKIPGLMDAAYNRYSNEFDMNNTALGQLMGRDSEMYGRFADQRDYSRGVFESDRGYNRDVFESDRGYKRDVYESDRGFNYQTSRDKIGDSQWLKEYLLSKSKISGSTGSGGGSGSSGGNTTKKKTSSTSGSKTETTKSAVTADWLNKNAYAILGIDIFGNKVKK